MIRIFSKTTSSKKSLNSLNFIKMLKKLKRFETDYIIKDGDLMPLMNLNDTSILSWKKYYNVRDKDLPHKNVLYKTDNSHNFIMKNLKEINNGKDNENIIWFDDIENF